MSDTPRPSPRPTRVTLASVVGTIGCTVLVLSLFDTMQRLQTTETREEIADTLADPPLRGSGVTVDQVLTGLRALGYTAGALAAAGIVLAVFVALRHRQARVGFTVVAALLLLTMPTTGLMPLLPALAAGMLWRRDARDWFAGRAPEPPARPERPAYSPPARHEPPATPSGPTPGAAAGPSAAPPASQPFAQPPSDQSQPQPAPGPYGQPPRNPYAQPPAQQQPAQPYGQPYAQPYGQQWQGGPTTDRRPGTVTAAAVLALLGASLGLVGGVMVMLGLAVAPGTVEEAITRDSQFERLDVTVEQVVALLWGTSAVMVLWSLVAIVLAVLTLRRNTVARTLLAVSAGMAALFSLIAILSGVAVVTLLLGGASVVLLFTGGANDWFAGRPRGSGGSTPVSGSGQPW